MTNPAGPPPIRLAPGKPEDRRPLTAPSFYITGRQPLSPRAILLAIVIAADALSLVLYVALASATAAQMELRRQTGGFSLLSAKEVQPGVLVFRLRDETPSATEALGTL